MKRYLGTSQVQPAAQEAAGFLGALRTDAAARFGSMSWPSQANDEEWKRTRVDDLPLDELGFEFAPTAALATINTVPSFLNEPEDVWGAEVPGHADWKHVSAFVSVQVKSGAEPTVSLHPDAVGLAEGLGIWNLADGSALVSGRDQALSGALADRAKSLASSVLAGADDRFVPWNLALHGPAFYLHIPLNYQRKEPIVIDWTFDGEDRAFFPLLLVDAESGSQAVVVQRLSGGVGALVNQISGFRLADNASLESHILQELASDTVYVEHDSASLSRDSRYRNVSINLGAGRGKTRSRAEIDGSGAEAHLDGFFFAKDDQHLDIRTEQLHRAPKSTSRAYLKGVVRDAARTVYQGLITVEHSAPGTDAFLENKNLVLNDGARADSIPCLQIRTNDVKCSHGSSTGRMDPEQLYYLQTRGFAESDARIALVQGYLDEVVDRLPAEIRLHVRRTVACLLAEGCSDPESRAASQAGA